MVNIVPESGTQTLIAGDHRIGLYMRSGGTIYRKSSEPDTVKVVRSGFSHAEAWRWLFQ